MIGVCIDGWNGWIGGIEWGVTQMRIIAHDKKATIPIHLQLCLHKCCTQSIPTTPAPRNIPSTTCCIPIEANWSDVHGRGYTP